MPYLENKDTRMKIHIFKRKLDKWLLSVPDTSIITRRQQKATVYIVYKASHRRKED